MKNWLKIIPVLYIVLCMDSFGADLAFPKVEFTPQDRVLILAPHPDDEAIACGGVIQEAVSKKVPIKIVFFTYGDNNQWSFVVYRKHPVIRSRAVRTMGLIRHDEAQKADSILGVSSDNLIFLGYPDFRTMHIWCEGWGNEPPIRSMLTRVNAVPYENAYRPGALYKGEDVLKDLKSIIHGFKPTKIFVSHPGDHNVDHRALYLFTRISLWDLEDEIKPEIYPYLVHFKGWPEPRGYYPDKIIEPPALLKDTVQWKTYLLSSDRIKIKEDAVKAHLSQFKSSGAYLSSFVRQDELFGNFPEVNLVPNASAQQLLANRKEDILEYPEELLDKERAVFVGVEEKYVQLENNNLVYKIKLSNRVAEKVSVSLYAFGYDKNKPFAEMPKFHIKIGWKDHKIYTRRKILLNEKIEVIRDRNDITIKIPLEMLGNPQKVLTSVHSYMEEVPLDLVSWRILIFPNTKNQPE